MDIVGPFDPETGAVAGFGPGQLAGWVNADPGAGQKGAYPPAEAFKHPMQEIVNAISGAGLTPDESDLTQLAQAVRSHGLNFRAAGGSADALTVTLDPVPSDWNELEGTPLIVGITDDNTGAATLSVNGLAARDVVWQGRTLWAGALKTDVAAIIVPLGDVCCLLNPAPMAPDIQIYNVAGGYTFTVPAGVYVVEYAVVGAGGSAGYSTSGVDNHGEGGGGGGGAYGRMAVTPGQEIAVVVGAVGGRVGQIGLAGGTSSFGGVSATGGGATSEGLPGDGGVGVGGDLNFKGQAGLNTDSAAGSRTGSGGDAGGPMGGGGNNGLSGGGWPGGGGYSYWTIGDGTFSDSPAAPGGVILQWGGGIV